VIGRAATLDSITRHFQKLRGVSKNKDAIENTQTGNNGAAIKEDDSKKTLMSSKKQLQFKLKCRTSFSRASHMMSRVEVPNQYGQRKNFAESENKKIEQVALSNRAKIDDFLEEWELCNTNFNERRVKVLLWTGEAFKVENFIREAFRMKSFYFSFRMRLERDQNFSRKTPVLNLEFPIFSDSPRKLKFSWDVNKCDKNRIRQMRLRKIIDCVNKVLNRQRAAKKLTLLTRRVLQTGRCQRL